MISVEMKKAIIQASGTMEVYVNIGYWVYWSNEKPMFSYWNENIFFSDLFEY